jgi:hypothetical protein
MANGEQGEATIDTYNKQNANAYKYAVNEMVLLRLLRLLSHLDSRMHIKVFLNQHPNTCAICTR